MQVSASGRPDGLLFYLSGKNGGTADFAAGRAEPHFFEGVPTVEGGVNGPALRVGCEDSRFSHLAPGNIYAQRGTLSFFWRSVAKPGPTEFPIFRVSYADHTSWDTTWLRIDYNGWGFDAFVTDRSLGRTRVSYALQPMPQPERWVHLALSWDEQTGICFYVDGKRVRRRESTGVYDAALDSFGPHGRFISYWGCQNRYNFIRPFEMCELRIYDRMLSDENIRRLAALQEPGELPELPCYASDPAYRAGWSHLHGFDAGQPPRAQGNLSMRRLHPPEAYDQKRWSYKCFDGIAETTWPGVYNRSSLEGRTDYFVLPDWDCYSVSGESLLLHMPQEPCNYLEIGGEAYGVLRDEETGAALLSRPEGCERSFHPLDEQRGRTLRFVNEIKDMPISDLSCFYVGHDLPPEHAPRERYRLFEPPETGREERMEAFIRTRFYPDGRRTLYALPEQTPGCNPPAPDAPGLLPLVHLLLPFVGEGRGLDGLLLELPALPGLRLTIRIKDPVWQYRDMFHATVELSEEPARLWLDLRDRVLPERVCLYVTLAGSDERFCAAALRDAALELVFKEAAAAAHEHVQDRFDQLRDHFGNMVEERPTSEKFNAFNRFYADVTDLLRVCPGHQHAREYLYLHLKRPEDKPPVSLPVCPPDVPAWAFWQSEQMKSLRRVIEWWIDNRQIENGEFGGGLSDDGDLTALWPGPALCGIMPGKIAASLYREMEAFYENDMFCNGLCKIQTDQLHTLEDGVQALGQCLVLDPSNPLYLERAMETARAIWLITGINSAGHRHFRSAYYSGCRLALEPPWNFSTSDSFCVLHPVYLLAKYNGTPMLWQLLVEMADSMLAHYRDGKMHSRICFDTDEDRYVEQAGTGHAYQEDFLLLAVYEHTGDEKYLQPVHEHLRAQNRDCPEEELAARYQKLVEDALRLEYINTEGHVWVDRVILETGEIQKDRLGGIGHVRFDFYPRNRIFWRFLQPARGENIAIRIPEATNERLRILVYSLEEFPAEATITGGEVLPGRWELRCGSDNGSGRIETEYACSILSFGWGESLQVTLPPRQPVVLELKRLEPGTPYCERADLGISPTDIARDEEGLWVTVHNLGALDTAAQELALLSPQGELLARAEIPPLQAPRFLYPCTCRVRLAYTGAPDGCRVVIDPQGKLEEISKQNNTVLL